MTVSQRRKKKPFSKNEKILWLCSFFGSMLFLFTNFQQQQTLVDVLILMSITLSLLFLPLILINKVFII